jgi:shikimate kinase
MDRAMNKQIQAQLSQNLTKPIALIGLMGVGKTIIGQKLAHLLDVEFVDSDHEIEKAAGCTISDIFERYGEQAFRDGESRVLKRLVDGKVKVISTGGGAITNPEVAQLLWSRTVSIWIKSDIATIIQRTSHSKKRPLLNTENPEKILLEMKQQRYPIYSNANITIVSDDRSVDETARDALQSLYDFLIEKNN